MKHADKIAVGQIISIPEFDHLRPTFGGGSRPTQCRKTANVCGLYDNQLVRMYPFNPLSPWGFGYAEVSSPHSNSKLSASSKTAVERNAPWMKTAKGEIGVAEISGKHKSNPRIMEYFKASKYWGKDDSGAKNAWCGSFVAWVMQQHNINPVNNAFRAKEWKNFGKKIQRPVYGAIGIKSRKGGGHVAFIVGQAKDGSKYYMLGGNQKDKVQILEYPKNVWETFVFPNNHDAKKGVLPVYDGKNTAKAGQES